MKKQFSIKGLALAVSAAVCMGGLNACGGESSSGSGAAPAGDAGRFLAPCNHAEHPSALRVNR